MFNITPDYKRIAKNFFSLNALQLINYLVPLIILPYIVRVLGANNFGLIAIAQAFVLYFVSVSEYGFQLTGVRDISANRNDKTLVSFYFSTIMILKALLMILSYAIILLLVLNVDYLNRNLSVYLVMSLTLAGSVLFPDWLFQALERMEIITIINAVIKILQLVVIFIFVNQASDILLYAAILSIGQLLIGIAGFAVATLIFKVKVIMPPSDKLLNYLRQGFSLFSVKMGMNAINHSSVFILGIFAGEFAAGIYAAADKIRIALQTVIGNLINSAYPAVVAKLKSDITSYLKMINDILKISLLIAVLISVPLFIFSGQLVDLLFGHEFSDASLLLKMFSGYLIIVSAGMVYTILVLIANNQDQRFSIIIWTAVFLHIIILFILIPIYGAPGAAATVVLTELFLLAAVMYRSFRHVIPGVTR